MELQRRIMDFEAAGIRIFAISNEPSELLASFAQEHGITYSLLGDVGSEVIRRFGILNTLIDPDEDRYGLPFPGSYLVDERGIITRKFFHRRYQQRETAEVVLHNGFSLPLDMSGNPSVHDGSAITATLGADSLASGQRAELYVRIDLDDGMHAYGAPAPDGYVATEVRVTGPERVQIGEPRYPRTWPFRVEGIDEQFQVFEGAVEIAVPLISTERELSAVTLEIEVRYQACNDRECFLPRGQRLSLEVPIARLNTARRPG